MTKPLMKRFTIRSARLSAFSMNCRDSFSENKLILFKMRLYENQTIRFVAHLRHRFAEDF